MGGRYPGKASRRVVKYGSPVARRPTASLPRITERSGAPITSAQRSFGWNTKSAIWHFLVSVLDRWSGQEGCGVCSFRFAVRPVAGSWLFRSPGSGCLSWGGGSSRVAVTGDVDADELVEGALVDAVVSVAHDGQAGSAL